MSRLFSDVLPEWPLDEVEAGLASATETDVLAALELAENGRRLNARDFMALVSPAASPYLETMARIARDVTVRQFGRSIQLFTPLYLANYCTNQCVYCGFNTKNHIHRSMLTMDEVEAEGKVIAATGLRNILLLTGDAPKLTGPAYIAEAARRLRPYFPSIGVEVYSMSEDDYRMLVDAGVDSFTMFQETYNEELYLKLHPAGPKRDFRFRLNAPDRAARAGMRSVNVGALLGLDQWRRDAFYTGLHADWIQATYPGVDIAVSAPRMRPHEGSFNDIHPASERDLVQYIQALRLYLPAAGSTLFLPNGNTFFTIITVSPGLIGTARRWSSLALLLGHFQHMCPSLEKPVTGTFLFNALSKVYFKKLTVSRRKFCKKSVYF